MFEVKMLFVDQTIQFDKDLVYLVFQLQLLSQVFNLLTAVMCLFKSWVVHSIVSVSGVAGRKAKARPERVVQLGGSLIILHIRDLAEILIKKILLTIC